MRLRKHDGADYLRYTDCMKQFETRRDGFADTRIVERPERDLDDGEIRLAVDRFAFTANNITYAAAGDTLRYWTFFPASEDGWGIIPVWGFADITETKVEGLVAGQRVFGYFPPASEVIMQPDRITPRGFSDNAPHRRELPPGYNMYHLAPETSQQAEDERALLYPLHITSYTIHDSVKSADWHAAKQIVITSASSKTSLGLAFALREDANAPQTIGLTSPSRVEAVKGLKTYDTVLSYDDVADLPHAPTLVIDMAGNGDLRRAIHSHLRANLVHILGVGITHHDKFTEVPELRDISAMFFAPSVIQARMKDWGVEGFTRRSGAFLARAAEDTRDWLTITEHSGLDALAALYDDVRQGRRPATEGLMIAL